MQTVSHRRSPQAESGPLYEAEAFVEAMIGAALHGLTGGLTPVEALEQVVRLGGRVERFLRIAEHAA